MSNHSGVALARLLAFGLIAAALAATLAGAGHKADHPVQLVVPAAPGTPTDAAARTVAERLRETLGVPVSVNNRPGALGMIAIQEVKKADEHAGVLLFTSSAPLILPSSAFKVNDFDPARDLAPIAQVGVFDFGIAVGATSPFKTLTELIAEAKAKPGALRYAIPGPGAISHFLGAALGRAASVDIQAVPYRGAGSALTEVLAGNVAIAILPLRDLIPMQRDGNIRILAQSGVQRLPSLPDVPTVREVGFNVELTDWDWYGMYASTKTPRDVIDRINKAVSEAVRSPRTQEQLAALGIRPTGTTAAQLAQIQQASTSFMQATASAAGIKAE